MSSAPVHPAAVGGRISTTPVHPAIRTLLASPHSSEGRKIASLLADAGIQVNGSRPWDIQVHDERFYHRALAEGNLGAGESYMDGWWDVEALDEFFARIQRVRLERQLGDPALLWLVVKSRLLNRQRRWRSCQVAERHYNLGNDLYEAMLGRHMQYTCGYWKTARSLDEAQADKLDLVCRKLYLQPGMTVLELGSGFGGLARFIAAEYGCRVVSYNVSREQVEYARRLCAGLPVRTELRDYRQARDEAARFDRVVSVGLCEHIGYKNYRGFLELAAAKLRPGGLFLLHSIGSNQSYRCTDAWIDRYIFPNGVIPSIHQLSGAAEGLWIVEDLHNFGPDYDPTLMAWWNNFDAAWPVLRARYGERFRRMWRYYLLSCAGGFRARRMQLYQIVFSKGDLAGYTPVR